ncbi:MAG: radical SAM protein [Gammaproteobacteria bacterium]|nr:radical SAM protein [Gammaproteobacteria bacterium]MDH5653822.1 radical SAM protein [Gammaproteobacteria bacterium]
MSYSPDYIQPLFRPPSEANSLILQVTNGCSWNRCAFCEMYTAPQKKFFVKKTPDVFAEIEHAAQVLPDVRRIFLADGDALVLSTRRLLALLEKIKQHFPQINRIASYCLPRNVQNKSPAELQELAAAGLGLVYVGAESGDDTLLQLIQKGETFATTVEALQKLQQAGIKTSVMILNGLGGVPYTEQHALHSAQLVNESRPDYLATLVVSFPLGEARFRERFAADFSLLDQTGLFREMRRFIEHTALDRTIFRSDHASNYLVLKGVLGRDKQALLDKLDMAIHQPDQLSLRQEWQRGL